MGRDRRSSGIVVSEVLESHSPRGFRGLSADRAELSAGSHKELLFTERGPGGRTRLGTLDLTTGCVRRSAGTKLLNNVTIDPVRRGFVGWVSEQVGGTTKTTIERWEAASLTMRISADAPAKTFGFVYDATSDRLLTSVVATTTTAFGAAEAPDRLIVVDPATLREVASLTFSVHPRAVSRFAVRPGRGELALPYMTPCTEIVGRRGARAEPRPIWARQCREGPTRAGIVLVRLSPLSEIKRLDVGRELIDGIAWSSDGTKLFFECGERGRCEWEPESAN